MKKYFLFFTLLVLSLVTFAQKQTFNVSFDKIKNGEGDTYSKGMEEFTSKFAPAAKDGGIVVFNITGGKRNGERLRMRAKPQSFTDRDVPWTWLEGQRDFWRANIAPHIESTETEILVYDAALSNSKYEDGKDVDKFLMTEWTILNSSRAGYDIRKRILEIQTKFGHQIAVFTSYTGENRVYTSRRLPNGWKDLDESMDLPAEYDKAYGKGAWDKDLQVLNGYWKRTDRFLMTRNKTLSSK